MKLKYEFEVMDMGDEFVAVPVGDRADELHGMLRLNADAAEMLELVRTIDTPEEILETLCSRYPKEDKDDLGKALCDYLNELLRVGILEPQKND